MDIFKKLQYVCELQNCMYLSRNKLFKRNETFRNKIGTTRAHFVLIGTYKRNYKIFFEISEIAQCLQIPKSYLSSPGQSFQAPTIHLVIKYIIKHN